jgi:lysophospholipase L1-like esterase
MRIVCLGDSLTWGGYGGDYVAELVHLLPEHQLINTGVGGDTILNLLTRLDDDVLAHHPDAVFIMIGGNDAVSFQYPATRPYYTQVKKIPNGHITPDQFEQAYRDLLTRLHLSHALAWVGLEPSEYTEEAFTTLSAFNERARIAAHALNVPILDIQQALKPAHFPERPPLTMEYITLIGRRGQAGWSAYEEDRAQYGYTYTFDGIHPTPQGAKQIAELIAAFIS